MINMFSVNSIILGAVGSQDSISFFVPMGILLAIFYFMLIRPQQRKEKERQAMIGKVKSGDRIMFCGGIIGIVANVKEATLMVKVADNTKLEIARGAISKVFEKGEQVTKEDAKQ